MNKVMRLPPQVLKMKVIDRRLEAPLKKFFSADEQVLVRFQNGNYTVGRVQLEVSHTGAFTGETLVNYKQGRASRFFYLAD